jgi:hypothetical protein
MRMFSRWLAVCAGFTGFLVASSAFSQPVAAPAPSSAAADKSMKVDGSGATYTVQFVDDPLNALNDGVIIPRIVVRPGGLRTMLLRPRTSYVNEMLKSVETM